MLAGSEHSHLASNPVQGAYTVVHSKSVVAATQDSFFSPYSGALVRLVLLSAAIHQLAFTALSTIVFAVGQVAESPPHCVSLCCARACLRHRPHQHCLLLLGWQLYRCIRTRVEAALIAWMGFAKFDSLRVSLDSAVVR